MAITDAQGNFSFMVPASGTYYVTHLAEAPQTVYQSYPGKDPTTGLPNATPLSLETLVITLNTGDSSIQNNFAVQSPATATKVKVYYDTNNDSTYEEGIDQLLANVTVSIMQGEVQTNVGTTSANDGVFFQNMQAGSYQAQYVVPNGYLAQTATTMDFNLVEGETKELFFPVQRKSAYDIGIQKSVDKLIAKPGETLTYTITVRNLGNSFHGKNLLVRDTLPAGMTYL
jgi:uncharacterized repeat protein (TIGR01451 family)